MIDKNKMALLSNIKIVLVQTSHPGNIGATARAMKNMGLTQLVLVDPRAGIFPNPIAEARAAHAVDILQSLQIVDSLGAALADCSLTFAVSARRRNLEWPILSSKQAAKRVISNLAEHKIALVFGRENNGLLNEEVQMCHFQVQIPANQDYCSLNLAAAVQIVAYEIYQELLDVVYPEIDDNHHMVNAVTVEQLEDFYQHLEQVLQQIAFLDVQKPRYLMAKLRKIYNRASLRKTELDILRGILTSTQQSLGSVS